MGPGHEAFLLERSIPLKDGKEKVDESNLKFTAGGSGNPSRGGKGTSLEGSECIDLRILSRSAVGIDSLEKFFGLKIFCSTSTGWP